MRRRKEATFRVKFIMSRASKSTLWYEQTCLTPTAFANFSPGLFQPWVSQGLVVVTLKELAEFTKF
ncbi:MAG TPA: hypothetical protein VIR01_14440 [Pyrinomonadaceae bacterium]